MKVDQKAINDLLKKSDRELWDAVRAIAGAKGIRLPEEVPPPETMASLRSALGGAGGFSLGEAVRVISGYMKGKTR